MKYVQKSFTVATGGDAYRQGWDAVFGKKEPKQESPSDGVAVLPTEDAGPVVPVEVGP
jgi:hypothetical protein